MVATTAHAQKKYDSGATDTEIKIGNIMPYSGPASSYGVIGKTEEAFFKMINAEGGINGRKINFITYDDAYQSAEGDRAGAQAGGERRGAADLPAARHAVQFGDHEIHERQESTAAFRRLRRNQVRRSQELPLDDGLSAQLPERGRIYAKYIRDKFPNSKIAVLWQNDDAGKDQFKGLKDGLGDKVSMIIADKSYEVSDP